MIGYPGAVSHERILIDPAVMAGKPVIKGTRLTVELILRQLAVGHTIAEIVESYPALREEDVTAAIKFALDQLPGPAIAAE